MFRYKKAAHILEKFITVDDELQEKRDQLLFVLYNNLAHCQLQRGAYDDVAFMCKKTLQLPDKTRGDRAKLYYR